ncbi:MAG: ribosome-associated translation inhibitor RaiA [Acidobacteriota bacterium]|nr:MAG: ribosome-associated translation inhibitor RaiA [Acidobacteriota bacterium]
MEKPVQITFRNMEPSPAVDARIREEIKELEEFYDRIIGCRVTAEMPHKHRRAGSRFRIKIYCTVPGGEIVVNEEPSLHSAMEDTELERNAKRREVAAHHKDIYVAIRDAFKAARRQLEDFARIQRGDVKRHGSEENLTARIEGSA